MENHMIPITMTKKIWNLMRVYFLMARKGISSKRKLLLDLNVMLKRSKIAGKAMVGNLNFHHHRHRRVNHECSTPTQHTLSPSSSTIIKEGEYEFSCSDTPPAHHHGMFKFMHTHLPAALHGNKLKKGNNNNKSNNGGGDIKNSKKKNCSSAVVEMLECPEFFFDEENYEAVSRVLDTLALREGGDAAGATSLSLSTSSSMNLPGLGNGGGSGQRVRQLRVTDSPFPLTNGNDDHQVDAAAEDFINRFYSQLRQQRLTPARHGAE